MQKCIKCNTEKKFNEFRLIGFVEGYNQAVRSAECSGCENKIINKNLIIKKDRVKVTYNIEIKNKNRLEKFSKYNNVSISDSINYIFENFFKE